MSQATEVRPNEMQTGSPVAGKSILVTGGTTGIGRSLAKKLVEEGANVTIYGRHQKELTDALNDIQPNGKGQIQGAIADQSNMEDLEKVFALVDDKYGKLDILVNNAAVGASTILDSDYDEWEYVIKTNLLGYMACCRLAIDRMAKQKSGQIINIGSMSADAQDPNNVYVATKAGVRGFTKSMAAKANEMGIRVTVIEPGLTGSDMTKEDVETQRQWEREGKMLMAEDIAECAYYVMTQPERCDVLFVQIRPRLELN